MRSVKLVGILLCLLSAFAVASGNKLGIHDVSRVHFSTPVRIGTNLLPAGDYVVRHQMEGEEHVMEFQLVNRKDTFKAKCTLVPLGHKAPTDQAAYVTNAANERVLQELIIAGDTAKHVFQQ